MSGLLQDIRFALRLLVKNPGLSAVMIVTLGVAIGANTTVFSIVDSVLIEPLPYPQPDRLIRLYTQLPREGHESFRLSIAEYEELVAHTSVFESVGAWSDAGAPVSGGSEPARVRAAYVTAHVLRTLGVTPMLGRWITDDDTRFHSSTGGGGAPVVVLSHRLWQRAFAGDPSIIGREISVDGVPGTVIGVMPSGFGFPQTDTDLWIPTARDPAKPPDREFNHSYDVIARLKPGVTESQLRNDLASYMAWSKETYPPGKHPVSAPDHPVIARSLSDDTVGSAKWSLWLLQGAVAFLLLIAGANIASVLLARADARSREMTIRRAVGAHRGRIVRQLLTESLVLGVLGAALGVGLASWGVELAVSLLPDSAPRKHEIGISGAALTFAVFASLLASLLFGLAPALQAGASGRLQQAGARSTRGRSRLRRALVITEILLAVVLVVGCSLMLRSFARLQEVEMGFESAGLITTRIELPQPHYPTVAASHRFWTLLQERTRALPGVHSTTVTSERPLSRPENHVAVWAVGTAAPRDTEASSRVAIQSVGDQYAETMGIRVLRGRNLDQRDYGEPSTVMINEALASRLWPGEDAIGRALVVGLPDLLDVQHTVVGVLANIKQEGLGVAAPPLLYVPLKDREMDRNGHRYQRGSVLFVAIRSDRDLNAAIPGLRRIVASIDPRIALSEVTTMDDVLWQEVARPRFLSVMLAAFAGIALLLASIGVFGVMSHAVGQRTRELGIRKALGASSAQVRRMVLREGMQLVLTGVVLGLAAAAAINTVLAKLLASVLYDIDALDPWTFVLAPLVIIAIGGLACWLPARKATRVDPMLAMRSD